MARDPYEVLGVSRDATEKDITKAYHQLAWKLHPDRNPGDKEAEATFKDVQNAYEILNDPAKRSNYDRFGSPDGAAAPGSADSAALAAARRATISCKTSCGSSAPRGEGRAGIRSTLAASRSAPDSAGRTRGRRAAPAEDVEHEVTIPFITAATGGKLDLDVNGQTVSVTIPAGAKDGQSLRLKGLLQNGANLKLKVHIEPHARFRREGDDLLVDVPISLAEAVLGAKSTRRR